MLLFYQWHFRFFLLGASGSLAAELRPRYPLQRFYSVQLVDVGGAHKSVF